VVPEEPTASGPPRAQVQPGARRVAVSGRGFSSAWGLAAVGALVGSVLLGLSVGPVDLGALAVAREAASHLPLLDVSSPLSEREQAILWELRAPRVVLGALVGAMLALAGGAYQGVFRNPLADPYLLGAAAGAGLGATIAIAYGGAVGASDGLRPVAAFVGATVGVAAAYALGRSVTGGRGPATLVLAGVTVAAFLTAVQTFVQQRNTDTLQEVYAWILGRLSTSGWRDVLIVLPYVVLSSAAILLHRRLLDVLTLGDDEAASLGVRVGLVRLVVVAAATIGTAAAVAVSGLIGFVGIIVPHAIRLVAGGSYRIVLPLSLLIGAAFLVIADLLARTVLAPAELPIGVVTAFFGAPFFAVVLRTTRTVAP
jgi:iron complex transport system permease protein